MAIFEYECPKCKKIFTKILKKSTQQHICECGAWADKIISVPAWRPDHTIMEKK